MSDELPAKPETAPVQPTAISLKEFLESTPPGKAALIKEKVSRRSTGMHGVGDSHYVDLPTIQLHCSTEACNGIRFFDPDSDKLWLKVNTLCSHFLSYCCKNCDTTKKLYALTLSFIEAKPVKATKIGELPSFGPHTPARLISFIGPDRDNFLKGRRSESQGLGIGAFAYYRRIVESHKDRIFDELIRACKKTNAPLEVIKGLETAKKETQFTKAVESMKHGLPTVLLINGQHNPLTLLHSALSEALHDHTDEECLELAQNIRVVLTDLADRVSQALKEVSELDSAVAQLMKGDHKKKRPDSSTSG
jgi:hypothetical protein